MQHLCPVRKQPPHRYGQSLSNSNDQYNIVLSNLGEKCCGNLVRHICGSINFAFCPEIWQHFGGFPCHVHIRTVFGLYVKEIQLTSHKLEEAHQCDVLSCDKIWGKNMTTTRGKSCYWVLMGPQCVSLSF